MRKKYLSALLFGALLVTSTGTFTSCKDYDDDINNLQEQITANADAIKALEELVKAGKYVSAVSGNGNVIQSKKLKLLLLAKTAKLLLTVKVQDFTQLKLQVREKLKLA